MHSQPALAATRAVPRRAAALAVLAAALAGCAGPQVVKDLGPGVGMHLYLRAPARQVVERLPAALGPAGFELKEVYTEGPPLWEAVAKLGAGVVGDGQWARITIREVGPQICLVRTASALSGGGLAVEDPHATARNILINIYLLNAPEVQAQRLAELRRAALQGGGDR